MAQVGNMTTARVVVLYAFLCMTGLIWAAAAALSGDLLLYNGRIHTMDADDKVVSVVAIKNGKIVYVGNTEQDGRRVLGMGPGMELSGNSGGETSSIPAYGPSSSSPALQSPRIIDLGGRVALPGLIDNHNHIVLMGNRPGYHTPLENAYSIADVQAALKTRAADLPKDDKSGFVTTIGGFHPNQFKERRLPTLAELDAAVSDRPVFVSYSFSGPSATNSKGKAFFESLSPPDQPPVISPNGAIASGTENGKALLALRRRMGFEDRKRGVRDAMKYAAEMGVTTHLDQGAFPATGTPSDGSGNEDLYTMHLPFLAVYGEGRKDEGAMVRLRVNFIHMDGTADLPTLKARLLNSFPFFGNDMVRTGGIGEFIASNYSGGPVFEEAARRIAEARWRLEVHSLTASDFATQIEAFEKVDGQVAGGVRDLRWVVAHVPLITREYLLRLKALGGGVNLSGWQYLAGRGPRAGPPFRDIAESGIRAGIGADGMNIAPMNPWLHAYYATTGKNALGEQINQGQQIGRREVMRMYTRANQWFLGGPDEALLGAVEVGRLGDLVVLNDDYFAVPDEELKKLRSVLTVVGGVVVHDSGR